MRPEQAFFLFICVIVLFFLGIEISEHIPLEPYKLFNNASDHLGKSIPDSDVKKNAMLHSNKNGVSRTLQQLPSQSPDLLRTPLLTKIKCSQRYRLLIMVTTRPDDFERRSNIRSTWGGTWHQRTDLPLWKTIFQLGLSNNYQVWNKTVDEAVKHRDMIFGNFTDNFFKLPVKVIMGFEWATRYCNFDFLLKADDDVFVNIPNVFKFLSEPDIPRHKLYAGNVHFQTEAIRFRHPKYYVNILEYPYRKYPRFTSGGGMVFSRDVVAGMVNIHNNSNYFKLDDVYIGMLALRLGVDAHHDDWFQLFKGANDCKCEEKTIVRHGAENKDCMEKLYNCFPNLYENYAGFVIKEK